MRIGIPKEIKNNENRVAITPAGVIALTKYGHEVSVEKRRLHGCRGNNHRRGIKTLGTGGHDHEG